MTTRTRTKFDLAFDVRSAALTACLALTALGGPLPAGPFNGQAYAPTNGSYAAPNGYYVQPVAIGSAPAPSCASCGVPAAASVHPGPRVDCPPPYYHVFEGPPHLKF